MKYEIGDTVTDESGHYKGVVCIVWNDGDICSIENDAAHPNPRRLTSHLGSSGYVDSTDNKVIVEEVDD